MSTIRRVNSDNKMSGVPKHEIMSPIQMEALANETRIGNRLYSRTSDGAEVVKALVSRLAINLANRPKKIDLRDCELIESVAVAYVDACSKAGTLPSKIGLCLAMGISRQAVDVFMKVHPEEASTELLRQIFDGFADVLNSAALTNACHPIVGIFTLKAQNGWRDTVSIEAESVRDPIEERQSVAAILAKYDDVGGLPD